MFEMKDLHPLVIKDGDAMMIFFQVKADDDLKKLKVSKLLTSNYKP